MQPGTPGLLLIAGPVPAVPEVADLLGMVVRAVDRMRIHVLVSKSVCRLDDPDSVALDVADREILRRPCAMVVLGQSRLLVLRLVLSEPIITMVTKTADDYERGRYGKQLLQHCHPPMVVIHESGWRKALP